MKTTKIILISALVTLGTALWGQPGQMEYITVSQAKRINNLENMVNGLLSPNDRSPRREYMAPQVEVSFTVVRADVIYEEKYRPESWMLSPFQCGYNEDNVRLEPWMTAPFESHPAEPELTIERWMMTPFETDDNLKIEAWMTSSF